MGLDGERWPLFIGILALLAGGGCLRAHIVPCDVVPCTDAGGGDADAGASDARPDSCQGSVLCDSFDDRSLASGLVVSGRVEPAWTIVNIDADSWREVSLPSGDSVLASGPGPSGSWWGDTCGGTVSPGGPAIVVAPPFAAEGAPGFAIDFDYFQTTATCEQNIVGVGLTGTEPPLGWSEAAPHFLGDAWFFAMAGVGVELRSPRDAIFDTGVVGFPAAGVWYHFHVEVCADGRFDVLLTRRDDGEILVTATRVAPDARLALGPRAALQAYVFATGAGKHFDNLRVTPECTL